MLVKDYRKKGSFGLSFAGAVRGSAIGLVVVNSRLSSGRSAPLAVKKTESKSRVIFADAFTSLESS